MAGGAKIGKDSVSCFKRYVTIRIICRIFKGLGRINPFKLYLTPLSFFIMVIDLLAALLITYGFYRGYSNGLIDTVVDTLSILIGLVVALKFSPLLIEYLQKVVNLNPAVEFILGFLILFFAVMLLLRFIGDRLEGVLKAIKINFINQLAGGFLLGFVAAFLIGLLLLLLTNLKVLNPEFANQSTLYEHLIKVSEEGGWVVDAFKDLFSEFWSKFMTTIDSVKENLE